MKVTRIIDGKEQVFNQVEIKKGKKSYTLLIPESTKKLGRKPTKRMTKKVSQFLAKKSDNFEDKASLYIDLIVAYSIKAINKYQFYSTLKA